MDRLEKLGHGSGVPRKTAIIADCGTLPVGDVNKKWEELEAD